MRDQALNPIVFLNDCALKGELGDFGDMHRARWLQGLRRVITKPEVDRILAAMELTRDDVYIANILKCRPPGNRDPQQDEMEKCFPHLREQVSLIRPKVICALGRVAAQAMLQTTTPLGKLRGQWHSFAGVPMMVTYHPAALLRNPAYKKDTWVDMQTLLAHSRSMK